MIKNKKDKHHNTSAEKKEIEIKINTDKDKEFNAEAEANGDKIDGNLPESEVSNSDVSNSEVSNSDDTKIKELEKQISQLKDQYLRNAAEFENYKRRTDSERAEFFAYAGERVLTDMLPVLDDFDRTMESFEKSHDKDALKKGIDLVYEKFKNVLAKQGLKPMVSDGKKFDVNLHEAILQQPDGDKEPDTVLNTVEKGYYLKDKVLRHAKVVVSSKPE